MGDVHDVRLIGLWDSTPYDYGVMEAGWLCLRADGMGWSAWSNIGLGASLSRFTWRCPRDDELELRFGWRTSGTWDGHWRFGRPTAFSEISSDGPDDRVVRTRYVIGVNTTPLVESAGTSLQLDEPVAFCHRFGLRTRETDVGPAAGASP